MDPKKRLVMWDLCCGLKGWSAAATERGWDVWSVDTDPKFAPTFCADVRSWDWRAAMRERGARRPPDIVVASPPCIEFSRESMPWTRRGIVPDMSVVNACVSIARESGARFWLLENVRGALRWFRPTLGEPRYRLAPQFLWGCGPVTFQPPRVKMFKKQHAGDRPDLRAMVPWHLSLAVARAVELDSGDRRPRRRIEGAPRADQAGDVGGRPAAAGVDENGRAPVAIAPSSSLHVDQDLAAAEAAGQTRLF